jgi:hypothetical protein
VTLDIFDDPLEGDVVPVNVRDECETGHGQRD